MRLPMQGPLVALTLALALASGAGALHHQCDVSPGLRRGMLRLRGGELDSMPSYADADALRKERAARAARTRTTADSNEDEHDLKALAKRRAEQARRAGPHARDGIAKTAYRVFFSATNKIGLTGSSTRVVDGHVVVRRNVIQKIFHVIYIFFRAIYYFFKSLIDPSVSYAPPKKGSGGGRGSFAQMAKSNVVKMADLPPMPGG